MDVDTLRSLFDYKPDTGKLLRKTSPRYGINVGDEAGSPNGHGYLCVKIKQKLYPVHLIAWAMMTGSWPEQLVDHKDTNRQNNEWDNLREVTHVQNLWNQRKRKTNTSGVKGVYWSKPHSKWLARVQVNGSNKYLGLFEDLELAKNAVQQFREELHGEFANNGGA